MLFLALIAARGAAAQTPAAQPELTTLKSTFMAGDKTIFYDDFTGVSAGGDIRQLTATQRGILSPNLTALPKNFTYEAELKVDGVKRALTKLILYSGNRGRLVFTASAGPSSPPGAPSRTASSSIPAAAASGPSPPPSSNSSPKAAKPTPS